MAYADISPDHSGSFLLKRALASIRDTFLLTPFGSSLDPGRMCSHGRRDLVSR